MASDRTLNKKNRCKWPGNDPLYIQYHDEEWGVPVHDDYKLFEFLILETFQAGLSWITILRKRENFREAFADFDFNIVAKFTNQDFEKLVNNSGIIRNKQKINSAINNANRFIEVRSEFGSFANYMWSFVNNKPVIHEFLSDKQVPATTELSDILSKDMKKRGFKFVGSTVIYAHLQAVGVVNDHITSCFRHKMLK